MCVSWCVWIVRVVCCLFVLLLMFALCAHLMLCPSVGVCCCLLLHVCSCMFVLFMVCCDCVVWGFVWFCCVYGLICLPMFAGCCAGLACVCCDVALWHVVCVFDCCVVLFSDCCCVSCYGFDSGLLC